MTPTGYRKLGLRVGDHVIVHVSPPRYPIGSDCLAGSYTLSGVVYELPGMTDALWVARQIVALNGGTPPEMNVLVTEPAVEVTE